MSEHTPYCIDKTNSRESIFCVCRNEIIKALEAERDKLIQVLATERDAFGKRETELISKLNKSAKAWGELLTDKEMLQDKYTSAEAEITRLKAEVEKYNQQCQGDSFDLSHGCCSCFGKMHEQTLKDRDTWKAKYEEAEKVIEERGHAFQEAVNEALLERNEFRAKAETAQAQVKRMAEVLKVIAKYQFAVDAAKTAKAALEEMGNE